MSRPRRLPDFAGVALVDILANGLAMLIIVIVLSIATRAEHEERTSAQVEELETMMSRRFSTSLVLNSLAASPPARLHDYVTSAIDQVLDPITLPIIELHRNFVREYYSGRTWTRGELLREPNAMDAWLETFDEEQKLRIRVDVYDIKQFYLVMSILRDHAIRIRHWHYLERGNLSLAQGDNCPPGVSAQDCATLGDGDATSALPNFGDGKGEGEGDGDGEGGAQWPPKGLGGEGDEIGDPGPFPDGAALGGVGGDGGNANGFGEGSFPNARPGGTGRGLFGGEGDPNGNQTRFRLSTPESLRQEGLTGIAADPPSTEQILVALLDYVGALQATLDAGASPSALLENFDAIMRNALAAPLAFSSDARRDLVNTLRDELRRIYDTGNDRALQIVPLQFRAREDSVLIAPINQRLHSIVVGQAVHIGDQNAQNTQNNMTARAVLRLHAHPDIWRGLTLPLEANGILLMPPDPQLPDQPRWRALAYIAPAFDDFIIGFAYSAIDGGGQLVIHAEDNRVRLDGRALLPPYRESFGARSWLVALYGGLAAGLLGLFFAVRRFRNAA